MYKDVRIPRLKEGDKLGVNSRLGRCFLYNFWFGLPRCPLPRQESNGEYSTVYVENIYLNLSDTVFNHYLYSRCVWLYVALHS